MGQPQHYQIIGVGFLIKKALEKNSNLLETRKSKTPSRKIRKMNFTTIVRRLISVAGLALLLSVALVQAAEVTCDPGFVTYAPGSRVCVECESGGNPFKFYCLPATAGDSVALSNMAQTAIANNLQMRFEYNSASGGGLGIGDCGDSQCRRALSFRLIAA